MAVPQFPFANRLIAGATAPQVQVPYRPVQTQTPAPVAPVQNQDEMLRQRAFQAALARPDMPIPPEFSTGSALGDEQERLRARYALMRDAGRSAVAERARAQGRSVTYDQAGNPVIGDMPQTPIVQAGPEGTRIAYRNGMPVGFSTPTATPSAEEMRFNQPYRSDAAARDAAQQRATEIMRSGAQKFNADNATRGVQMTPTGGYLMTPMGAASAAAAMAAAPVAAPVAAAPYVPSPSTRALMTVPMPAILSAPAAPLASAERTLSPEQALAQAEQFLQEEPARIAEETSRKEDKEYRDQIAKTTQELAQARIQKDVSKVRQLSAKLNNLLVNTPGKVAEQQMARFGALGMGVGLPSNIGGTTATPVESTTPAPPTPSPAVATSSPATRPPSPEEVRKNLFDIAAATQAVRREQAASNPPAQRGFFAPIRDFLTGSPELSSPSQTGATPAASWARRLAIRDAFQRGELTEAEANRLLGSP
jgi:hypothetical protein